MFNGSVTLTIDILKDSKYVVLDYVGIDIMTAWVSKVDGDKKTQAKFNLYTDLNKNLGNALQIVLPDGFLDDEDVKQFKVIVYYNTNAG